jgi:hypothetical protein
MATFAGRIECQRCSIIFEMKETIISTLRSFVSGIEADRTDYRTFDNALPQGGVLDRYGGAALCP